MADTTPLPDQPTRSQGARPTDAEADALLAAGLEGAARPLPGGVAVPSLASVSARFPELEVIEWVGQGGMGVVYKVRQRSLDRVAALKVLPEALGQDPSFAERFTREARTLAKLRHPHIVGVYEFGEREGQYYLLMEFVDGVTLRELMSQGSLTPPEALAIVPQVCDALQAAHDAGVVHRDIKPENVLLDRAGRVKVADFGLAKLTQKGLHDVTLTGTHQVMGTFQYMAPEQIRTPAQVDHRADIFSLGVVFYEMLTGELPVGRFQKPSEAKDLDARLDEIVLKALERERDLRFQSASEVDVAISTMDSGSTPDLEPRSQAPSEPSRRATTRAPWEPWIRVAWYILPVVCVATALGLVAFWQLVAKPAEVYGELAGLTWLGTGLWVVFVLLTWRSIWRTRPAAGPGRPRGHASAWILMGLLLLAGFLLMMGHAEVNRDRHNATWSGYDRPPPGWRSRSVAITGVPHDRRESLYNEIEVAWSLAISAHRRSPRTLVDVAELSGAFLQDGYRDMAEGERAYATHGIAYFPEDVLKAPLWAYSIAAIHGDLRGMTAVLTVRHPRVYISTPLDKRPMAGIRFYLERVGTRWQFTLKPYELLER